MSLKEIMIEAQNVPSTVKGPDKGRWDVENYGLGSGGKIDVGRKDLELLIGGKHKLGSKMKR